MALTRVLGVLVMLSMCAKPITCFPVSESGFKNDPPHLNITCEAASFVLQCPETTCCNVNDTDLESGGPNCARKAREELRQQGLKECPPLKHMTDGVDEPNPDGTTTGENRAVAKTCQGSVVNMTLAFPSKCPEEPIICSHGKTSELAQVLNCSQMSESRNPTFTGRIHLNMDCDAKQLTITLEVTSSKDGGKFACRKSSMKYGTLVSEVELMVDDGADLKQSCSYSPTDRTVRCDNVTTEVKVYRKGKHSDRDVRYFSNSFVFQLGEGEEGFYVVTQIKKKEDDALCSSDFEFQVEKSGKRSRGEYLHRLKKVLFFFFTVMGVVFLCGIDFKRALRRLQSLL